MSDTRVAPHHVRYRERLWVPWWWWPPAFALAGIIAFEFNMGVTRQSSWWPYAALFAVAAAALLWLGRIEVRVTANPAVPAGTTVTWINRDEEPHTVAASDGSFHSPGMGTGAVFTHTFSAAGTFDYVCSIHPMMRGTVVVTG